MKNDLRSFLSLEIVTMSEDAQDEMLLRMSELLHLLVRETEALEKAVEKELLSDDQGGGRGGLSYGDDYQKHRSLYRDLEWRVNNKQLTFSKAARALGLILREVAFFSVAVHNSYGSLTQGQPLLPNKRPIRVEPLIEEVVDLFEYSALAKGVEMRTQIAGNPILNIDRGLIHRVLVNLIDNAVKYSYSSAEASHQRYISVDCRRHSVHGDWVIAISSYGVGIDEHEITSGVIYEYGRRGRFSSDRRRSGTGIGLAEAKRIVDAHHGKIHVESTRTAGDTFLTTVKVILPGT